MIGVRAFAIQPNSLGIRGAGRGLQVALLGNDYDALSEQAAAAGRGDGGGARPSATCA